MPKNLVMFADGNRQSHSVEILDEEVDLVPRHRLRCLELLEVFELWSCLPRLACGLPAYDRGDFDTLGGTTTKLSLLEVRDWQTDDFEYTFYGKHPADFVNGGKPLLLADLKNDPRRQANFFDMKRRVGHCVESGRPSYVHKTLSWNDVSFIAYEVIYLPFARKDGTQPILTPTSAYAAATDMGEIAV